MPVGTARRGKRSFRRPHGSRREPRRRVPGRAGPDFHRGAGTRRSSGPTGGLPVRGPMCRIAVRALRRRVLCARRACIDPVAGRRGAATGVPDQVSMSVVRRARGSGVPPLPTGDHATTRTPRRIRSSRDAGGPRGIALLAAALKPDRAPAAEFGAGARRSGAVSRRVADPWSSPARGHWCTRARASATRPRWCAALSSGCRPCRPRRAGGGRR